jgi:hypothetical protein
MEVFDFVRTERRVGVGVDPRHHGLNHAARMRDLVGDDSEADDGAPVVIEGIHFRRGDVKPPAQMRNDRNYYRSFPFEGVVFFEQ